MKFKGVNLKMIKSMTGYGRFKQTFAQRDILVEIKSVNHRYYEFNARVPRTMGYIEEPLKNLIGTKVCRGKVEVNVSVFNHEGVKANVSINKQLAKSYVDAIKETCRELHLINYTNSSDLISLPDIFTVEKIEENQEEIISQVLQTAQTALDDFVTTREKEGKRLGEDLLAKLENVEKLTKTVEQKQPEILEDYKQRLLKRISETLEDKNIEQSRILTEVAIFADKVAVDEEVVRLASHISQLKELISEGEAIGRKLDFIVQECNREVNTIGSKSQDLEVTKTVVELKSEIEKIREQIQNIE